MCGINEKGTVPAEGIVYFSTFFKCLFFILGVEPEGSTSEFTIVRFSDQIIKHGKVRYF